MAGGCIGQGPSNSGCCIGGRRCRVTLRTGRTLPNASALSAFRTMNNRKPGNPADRLEYILKAERFVSRPTKFILRRLTSDEMFVYTKPLPFTIDQIMQAMIVRRRASLERRALTKNEAKVVYAALPKSLEEMRCFIGYYAHALELGLMEIVDLQDENGKPQKLHPVNFIGYVPVTITQELGDALFGYSLPKGHQLNRPTLGKGH